MDYRVASNIRGKSLSSLMTDKIVSGKGIGSAFGGAISDKLKARATGVKEKFDPMNIAKFMTGGSRLGPAIMGRLTGRSQADINYFAGDKRRKGSYTQVPTSMSTPGEGLGGSAVEVLNKMLAFMQKTREDDLKRKETAKQFTEEQKVEDQRRHKEFLEVLKQYTSLNTTATLAKEEEGGGGLMDNLFNFIKAGLSSLQKLLQDWVGGLLDKLMDGLKWINGLRWMSLAGMVSAPAMIAALIAAGLGAAVIALWKSENEKLKNLGGSKAEDLSGQRQTEEMLGAMDPNAFGNAIMNAKEETTGDKIKKAIAEKQEVVRALMEDEGYNADSFDKNGGYVFKDAEGKSPPAELLKDVSTKADQLINSGETLPQVKSKKKLLPYGMKQSEGRSGVAQLMDYKARERPLVAAFGGAGPTGIKKAVPVSPTPSSRLSDAVSENLNLNYDPMGNSQSAPVIMNNSSSVDLPDRPIPATATVRDKTPILDYVFEQYASPI